MEWPIIPMDEPYLDDDDFHPLDTVNGGGSGGSESGSIEPPTLSGKRRRAVEEIIKQYLLNAYRSEENRNRGFDAWENTAKEIVKRAKHEYQYDGVHTKDGEIIAILLWRLWEAAQHMGDFMEESMIEKVAKETAEEIAKTIQSIYGSSGGGPRFSGW